MIFTAEGKKKRIKSQQKAILLAPYLVFYFGRLIVPVSGIQLDLNIILCNVHGVTTADFFMPFGRTAQFPFFFFNLLIWVFSLFPLISLDKILSILYFQRTSS